MACKKYVKLASLRQGPRARRKSLQRAVRVDQGVAIMSAITECSTIALSVLGSLKNLISSCSLMRMSSVWAIAVTKSALKHRVPEVH